MNPGKRNCRITTSWDDGHPLDMRVAELLVKHRLTGTFYVPRSSQRPVMNPSQIRELAKSFEIGGHTLEHVAIDTLPDAEALAQLSGSREWIEQLTGTRCRVFCFPGGKFRNRQLPLVRQAGYEAVRTVELLSTANPLRIDGLCVIPTTVQAFPHAASAYARNALKRFSASAVFRLGSVLLSRDWARLARVLLLQTKDRGGVFHLWGHSWEIAEQEQWKVLEDFLVFAGEHLKSAHCVTNGDLCAEYAESPRKNTAPAFEGENPRAACPIEKIWEKEVS
jgi:peptidoglycan/xylan/chitin deacetylase (PgdA/CDA1 family)